MGGRKPVENEHSILTIFQWLLQSSYKTIKTLEQDVKSTIALAHEMLRAYSMYWEMFLGENIDLCFVSKSITNIIRIGYCTQTNTKKSDIEKILCRDLLVPLADSILELSKVKSAESAKPVYGHFTSNTNNPNNLNNRNSFFERLRAPKFIKNVNKRAFTAGQSILKLLDFKGEPLKEKKNEKYGVLTQEEGRYRPYERKRHFHQSKLKFYKKDKGWVRLGTNTSSWPLEYPSVAQHLGFLVQEKMVLEKKINAGYMRLRLPLRYSEIRDTKGFLKLKDAYIAFVAQKGGMNLKIIGKNFPPPASNERRNNHWNLVPIEPDGHCFYRSVLRILNEYQLEQEELQKYSNDLLKVAYLRQTVLNATKDSLETKKGTLYKSISENMHDNWSTQGMEYGLAMAQKELPVDNKGYATQIDVIVAARIFNISMCVSTLYARPDPPRTMFEKREWALIEPKSSKGVIEKILRTSDGKVRDCEYTYPQFSQYPNIAFVYNHENHFDLMVPNAGSGIFERTVYLEYDVETTDMKGSHTKTTTVKVVQTFVKKKIHNGGPGSQKRGQSEVQPHGWWCPAPGLGASFEVNMARPSRIVSGEGTESLLTGTLQQSHLSSLNPRFGELFRINPKDLHFKMDWPWARQVVVNGTGDQDKELLQFFSRDAVRNLLSSDPSSINYVELSMLAEDVCFEHCRRWSVRANLQVFNPQERAFSSTPSSVLKPHQRVAERAFVPESTTKGFCMFYNVGSGKTCAALSCVTKYWIPRGYKVLWVAKKSIQEATTNKNNYYLTNPKSIEEYICNYQLFRGLQDSKVGDREDWFASQKGYFKEYFQVLSFKNFTSAIKKNGGYKYLRKTIVVFDEVHMKYTDRELPRNEFPNLARESRAFHLSYEKHGEDSVRFLALTSTPVTPSPYPLICLLGLAKERGVRKDLFTQLKKKLTMVNKRSRNGAVSVDLQRNLCCVLDVCKGCSCRDSEYDEIEEDRRARVFQKVEGDPRAKRQSRTLMKIHDKESVKNVCLAFHNLFGEGTKVWNKTSAAEAFRDIFSDMYLWYDTDDNITDFPQKILEPTSLCLVYEDEYQCQQSARRLKSYLSTTSNSGPRKIAQLENYAKRSSYFDPKVCKDGASKGLAQQSGIDLARTGKIMQELERNELKSKIQDIELHFNNLVTLLSLDMATQVHPTVFKHREKGRGTLGYRIISLAKKHFGVFYDNKGEMVKLLFQPSRRPNTKEFITNFALNFFQLDMYKRRDRSNDRGTVGMQEYQAMLLNATHRFLLYCKGMAVKDTTRSLRGKIQNILEKIRAISKVQPVEEEGALSEQQPSSPEERCELQQEEGQDDQEEEEDESDMTDEEEAGPRQGVVPAPGKGPRPGKKRSFPRYVDHFDKQKSWQPPASAAPTQDHAYFDRKCFSNTIAKQSAKLQRLVENIVALDEKDRQLEFGKIGCVNGVRNRGLRFKHAIYCETNMTAKVVISALLSAFQNSEFLMRLENPSCPRWVVGDQHIDVPTPNRIALLTKGTVAGVNVSSENERDILNLFNDRERNAMGHRCRFLVYTQKFSTGVDLFDVRHCHVFDMPTSEYMMRQVTGRACRQDPNPQLPVEFPSGPNKMLQPKVFYHFYQTLVKTDQSGALLPCISSSSSRSHSRVGLRKEGQSASGLLATDPDTQDFAIKTFKDWAGETVKRYAGNARLRRTSPVQDFDELMEERDLFVLDLLRENCLVKDFLQSFARRALRTKRGLFADHRKMVIQENQARLRRATCMKTISEVQEERKNFVTVMEGMEKEQLVVLHNNINQVEKTLVFGLSSTELITRLLALYAKSSQKVRQTFKEKLEQHRYNISNLPKTSKRRSSGRGRSLYSAVESDNLLGSVLLQQINVHSESDIWKEHAGIIVGSQKDHPSEFDLEVWKSKATRNFIPFIDGLKKEYTENRLVNQKIEEMVELLLTSIFMKSIKKTEAEEWVKVSVFNMVANSVLYANYASSQGQVDLLQKIKFELNLPTDILKVEECFFFQNPQKKERKPHKKITVQMKKTD